MAKLTGQIEPGDLGITIIAEADPLYIYGGHRNYLCPTAWQSPENEFARRMRYMIVPWLTVAAGDRVGMQLYRYDSAQTPERWHDGPIVNASSTALGLELLASPNGHTISGCDEPAPGDTQVEGTNWRLKIWLEHGVGPAYLHNVRVAAVHDNDYTTPIQAAEAEGVEQTDRALATSQAQIYDFVDSWSGQACMSHTLDMYSYEARCNIIVPLYSEEYAP